jgi:cell division protein FtsZ
LINITATRDSLRLHEVDAAAKVVEDIAGAEDTIFGAVYDERMGERIKITVIATGLNQNGNERTKGTTDHLRAVSNVIPLASSESGKPIDFQLASIKDNLDEPAFRRRRAE